MKAKSVSLCGVCAAVMVAVSVLPGYVQAAPYETSWIFRSGVTQGQSMWGPGTLPSYNFSGQYLVPTWPVTGTGFTWACQVDQGIVSGNVEGLLKAKYDSYSIGRNTTTINLSYDDLATESNITTSLVASLTGTPRVKFQLASWLPGIDVSMPISALNANLSAKVDFPQPGFPNVDDDLDGVIDEAGECLRVLGQTVAGNGIYKALPFSVDLALVNAHMDFSLVQNIAFTPQSITGSVKCTHMETGATRTVDATITTNGTDLALDLPLDIKGHWEIDLENFHVANNMFHQDMGLGVVVGIGIPLLGADWSFFPSFSMINKDFSLAFDNHGSDGNAATADNLGRFCIYVDPTIPEPSTAVLLAGGLGLLHRRRKARK